MVVVARSESMLDQQLCFALYSTSLSMTKVYKNLLQPLGLTYPQYLVMQVLWQREGRTVGEISQQLLIDPGSLTPLLKRLEAEGRIQRQRNPRDERVVHIFLTDRGLELEQAAKTLPEQVSQLLELTATQQRMLGAQLKNLRQNLQQHR